MEPDVGAASRLSVQPALRVTGSVRRLAHAAELIALAVVYVIAARIGLAMDAVAGFATLVWPPTGIALAALLLRGYRLWPGVVLGAGIANVLTGAPILVALGIAIGNTLEALIGTYALRRLPGFRPSLDRVRDVLGLIVLAATFSTMVSATIGVASLYVGGIVSPTQLGSAWRTWWLGDLIGALLVAPALLVWATARRARAQPHRLLEAAALALLVIAVGLIIFGTPGTRTDSFQQAYLVFPPLIWAALRFEQRGAASAAFIVSVFAVWGTATGNGPFVRSALYEGLFVLQTFMGVTAATFLLLGASIAERRRAIQDVQAAVAEQERLLAESRIAHEAVASANRAKAEFFAVMSHELRTPLNAIAGYVEVMELGIQGPVTDEQRDSLERIRRNQRHLLSLIDDVLVFSKIEADHVSLDLTEVGVGEALGELEPLIRLELQRKALILTCDAGDPSLCVRADPEKLRQILLNLVGNAIKFTPPEGRIELGAARDGDLVRISISDTGIGIPEDQLARVFEPFFQVERGPTRRFPGVGLGLAIARDLARAMAGDVRVESRVGHGTTFSVALPAA